MVEIRADIGKTESALVHIMNTGGTTLSFTFDITGEVKSRQQEQPLSSLGGCNGVPPGQECVGILFFFPLTAGDRTAMLTVHPTTNGLADTAIPVLARTYTRITTHVYPGSGTVTSNSPDVTCTQADCSGHFVGDLTLTATPSPGNVFVGWADAGCGTSPTCVVPRSTLPRSLSPGFAPVSPGQLTLNLTGAPAGSLVSVEDESGHSQSVLAACATSCVIPLPEREDPPQQIRVTVDSPRGSPAISGACTGTDRCRFPSALNATIAVRWAFDPRLPRTSVFELGGLRSVARGPNGELFASTLLLAGAAWTVKLDALGNVLWAYPRTGQLLATADGGVAVSFPDHGNFVQQRVEVLGADGYLVRRDVNQEVYASPTPNIEVDHFARTLALGSNQVFAMPGTKNGMSAIEGWGVFGTGIHRNATVSGDGARSIATDGAGVFYLATQPTVGSVYATKFDASGANLGSILDVAQGAPLVMAVSSGGDVITTSGTSGPVNSGGAGAEVILRRVSPTGQLRFERRVLSPATMPNRAGVVVLPNDDVMWIHGTRGQSGGSYYETGIVAERISPTGNVVWSFIQSTSTSATGGNVEVFDLNISDGVPVAAGSFATTTGGTRSWIGTFAP